MREDYAPMPYISACQIALRHAPQDEKLALDDRVAAMRWDIDQVVAAMQDAVRHYIAYREGKT